MTSFALRATCAVVALAASLAVQAQDAASYPSKPVTLVVPTAAGGGTDTIARMFADVLGKALKQPFIIDNRPGANGLLGPRTSSARRPTAIGCCSPTPRRWWSTPCC